MQTYGAREPVVMLGLQYIDCHDKCNEIEELNELTLIQGSYFVVLGSYASSDME